MENYENGILAQIRRDYGSISDTDVYKFTHPAQYRKGMGRMFSYFTARGGKYDDVVWYGIQMIVKEYMCQTLTHEQVDNLIAMEETIMGGAVTPALERGFRKVVDEYGGKLPITIHAAPEGLVIPTGQVMMTMESTHLDEDIAYVVGYFETKLLRVWSPMTVATESYHIRKNIEHYLKRSSDDWAAEIPFKLHDFGSRGISSMEAAGFAGSGHLLSFKGTDTTMALLVAKYAYGAEFEFASIPATEHSSTCSQGRGNERQVVRNMFDAYAKPGAVFATVIDTENWMSFIHDIAPEFKDELIESGATWVFRPDSGDPVEVPVKVVIELEKIFGSQANSRGYKVLNNVRVIQGDGIDSRDVDLILSRLVSLGYSATNMAFGMGGGLLQKNNRDTLGASTKCSAVQDINGAVHNVFKSPAVFNTTTWEEVDKDSFKKSKTGFLELMHNTQTGAYMTVERHEVENYAGFGWEPILRPIYRDGTLLVDDTFENIRNRLYR